MTQELLKLDQQVCFSLYSASNMISRAYRPLLNKLDLTYLQYIVMMVLWEHKSLNVSELGQRLRLDSGTLTPLLKRLEAKQLVVRKRGESDERVRQISLTSSGAALSKSAETIPLEIAARVNISREDALELKRLCDKLLAQADPV
jgi:DNA-binding MarR family transcriptional regulator